MSFPNVKECTKRQGGHAFRGTDRGISCLLNRNHSLSGVRRLTPLALRQAQGGLRAECLTGVWKSVLRLPGIAWDCWGLPPCQRKAMSACEAGLHGLEDGCRGWIPQRGTSDPAAVGL